MFNYLIKFWANTRKSLDSENICPKCQALRLACTAILAGQAGSSYGGFAVTSVTVFFTIAFLAWIYRDTVMVWVIKARIWFAQRRSKRASSPTTGNGSDGAANSHGEETI